jgi:preflagellin peptidase FlaK
MDWLPIFRVAIAFLVLSLAAYSDWRTRMASDIYWGIMGVAGLLFLGYQILADGADPLYLLLLFPIGWFFFDLLIERKGLFEEGINIVPLALYVVSGLCVAIVLVSFWGQDYLWGIMIIPIMFIVYFLLYILDIIKGGADAKALIALTLMVPAYPEVGNLPLVDIPTQVSQYIMPFSLMVLFYGALFTIAIPIYYLFFNLVRGDRRFPLMLFGIKMDLSEAKNKFVWPMEYVEGDEVKASSMPKGPESLDEHYASLESKGLTRIWVTPKIPMLIPISAGLVFAAFVGNLLFIMF